MDWEKVELNDVDRGSNYLVGTIKNGSSMSNGFNFLETNELVGNFDGINTFMDYVKSKMPEPRQKDSDYRDSLQNRDNGFNAFSSYKKAVDTFRDNPESLVDFVDNEERINGGESSGTQVEYDITGDFIDMSRFIEGIPETFGFLSDGNPRSKRIDIIVVGAYPCSVNHESISARSRRILRLVDWLESNNVRCKLSVMFGNECALLNIVVKRYDEHLDVNDLAVAFHPEFLRRLTFRFMEYSDTITYTYGSGVVLNNWFNNNDYNVPFTNGDHTLIIGNSIYEIDREFDNIESRLSEAIVDNYLPDNDRMFKILM